MSTVSYRFTESSALLPRALHHVLILMIKYQLAAIFYHLIHLCKFRLPVNMTEELKLMNLLLIVLDNISKLAGDSAKCCQ